MPQVGARIRLGAVVWGLALVFVGVALLLQFSGLLPWAFWGALLRFWPVVLILLGLALLLNSRPWAVIGIIAVVLAGGILASLATMGRTAAPEELTVQRDTFTAAGVDSAETLVDFHAGTLRIAAHTGDPAVLAEIWDARLRNTAAGPLPSLSADYQESLGAARLTVRPENIGFWDDWRVLWDLRFNPDIPLSLHVTAQASRLDIDLASLSVRDVRLDMDVSSGRLTLPAQAANANIEIDMDVSSLEIVVPRGVSARINSDGNLSLIEVDNRRFPRQGGYYESPDYGTSDNRLTLSVLCDVGRVVIK